MNFLSFVILTIIFACAVFALKKIYRDKKNGKSCCSCEGCSKNCSRK